MKKISRRIFLSPLTILFLLLIISLFYTLNVPIPLNFLFHDLVKDVNISEESYLNISVYRLYLPPETNVSEKDLYKNISLIFVMEPGGIHRLNVIGRVGGEVRDAGYLLITSNNTSEISLYVLDPYLNQKIPIGIYKGSSFDTIAQTTEYTAYLIIERVSNLTIRCQLNQDIGSSVQLLIYFKNNSLQDLSAGPCIYDMETKKQNIFIRDYAKYYVYIDLFMNPIVITYYESSKQYLFYPSKNSLIFTTLFISLILLFTGSIYVNYRENLKKTVRVKKRRKRSRR
ncbi:MAG: hypothetical protein ACP5GI_07680 [Sulfolobales archaeon]